MKRVCKLTITVFLTAVLFCVSGKPAAAEKADSATAPVESKMILNYLCGGDSLVLTATLSLTKNEMPLALENAPVALYCTVGTENVLLAKQKTDQEGTAVFKVPVTSVRAGKDGMVNYLARFEATAKYPASEATFTAKPARIKLFFGIQDSLRMLSVTATQKNEKGEEIALPKETVQIYVPRLFSLLKIGEIALDESGNGSMEFPKEIVGDTLGNLVVLARIEEHDVFGNLQGKNTINWGVHKQYYKAEVPSRELWTPIAPMWMIITLIIMLTGVWAHYAYAVYELVMIKKLSKKDKTY